jgi:uncharacterized protein (TIGR02246 family)
MPLPIRTLLIAAFAASVAGAQEPATASVQREIQPLLDDELVAANAHDTDRFLKAYLHDSSLVFVFNGSITRGISRLRELQLKAWDNGKSKSTYELRNPTEYRVLSPKVALAMMQLTAHRVLPTGETKAGDLTVTMVWEKRSDGWRIVQAHESSVPN